MMNMNIRNLFRRRERRSPDPPRKRSSYSWYNYIDDLPSKKEDAYIFRGYEFEILNYVKEEEKKKSGPGCKVVPEEDFKIFLVF
jgi:hypothetical protein